MHFYNLGFKDLNLMIETDLEIYIDASHTFELRWSEIFFNLICDPETHSEPTQTHIMELFCKTINDQDSISKILFFNTLIQLLSLNNANIGQILK